MTFHREKRAVCDRAMNFLISRSLWFSFGILLLLVWTKEGWTLEQMDDRGFFEEIDLDYPGLGKVKQAVLKGDFVGARAELAAHMATRQKPVAPAISEGANAQTLAEADRVMDHVFTLVGHPPQKIGKDILWNEDPVNYDQWAIALNRHSHWITLGRAYRQTLDEKYAQEFVDQLLSWVAAMPVQIGERYIQGLDDRPGLSSLSLDAGIRMGQTWVPAYAYFLHSPSFTTDAHIAMLKAFRDHALYLMDPKHFRTFSNWGLMESNGLYHIGVFFPEFKAAETWRKTAMDRLYGELDKQVYPDGAQVELTSGYHQVSLRNFVLALRFGRLNDQEIPDDYLAKLERMYHYDLYMAMPNLKMPALNDGGWTDIRSLMKEGFGFFPTRADFQWAATEGREGTRPETTSCAFPYAGHFVMRAGWEADDSYLFFDGGPFGAGHQHEDKLNIVVYSHGRVHVTDPGNYQYDTSKWRKYILSTRAHNTVMVDGMEQHVRGLSREHCLVSEPLPHTWITEPTFDYASASYGEGYGPDRDRTVTHTRSILFVKPNLWIVTDFLKASDEATHTCESMFHLDAEAAVLENGRGVETRNVDGGNLGIYGIVPPGTALEIVSGQEDPVVQGWIPRNGIHKCEPIPTPIFRAEGAGTLALSYVLCPIPPGAPSPVSYVERIPGSAGELAAVGGRIVMRDGREIYFGQREAGEGRMRADTGETDAEAAAVIIGPSGKIDRLILVNGTEALSGGRRLLEGEYVY